MRNVIGALCEIKMGSNNEVTIAWKIEHAIKKSSWHEEQIVRNHTDIIGGQMAEASISTEGFKHWR